MRASRAIAKVNRTRPGAAEGGSDEAGVAMMYILVMMGLLTVITIGVMLLIAADLSAGVRQSQAVRVFNIAEAGIHYAIARLQTSGASSYAGETVSITDGTTVLGTAVVAVGCLDGSASPCSGTYAAYRRIVSTGTVPVSGPSRTLVAVVQGSSSMAGVAFCGYSEIVLNPGVTVYGNVGSNGNIDIQGTGTNTSRVRNDPPPPYTNNGSYTGSATANGPISCTVSCATQVAGTTTPNAPQPPPVCPSLTLPAFSPGAANQTVTTAGWTMDASTGYDWNDVTVADAGTMSGCNGATPFSDVRIQTAAAGTTTVVNVRRLIMGRCGRLILLGAGNVDLRVGETALRSLAVGKWSRFGVLPTDTAATPAPVPAARLLVIARTTARPGVQVYEGTIVAAVFIVPYGEWQGSSEPTNPAILYGAVLADSVDLDGQQTFTYDPSAATLSIFAYSDFNRLKSWKDQ